MARIGFREVLGLLIIATVAAWVIPSLQYVRDGAVSTLAFTTALLLTAALAIWPFFAGKRVAQGRIETASMCSDCKSPTWPGEQALGFCLRCGSTKPAVAMGV